MYRCERGVDPLFLLQARMLLFFCFFSPNCQTFLAGLLLSASTVTVVAIVVSFNLQAKQYSKFTGCGDVDYCTAEGLLIQIWKSG